MSHSRASFATAATRLGPMTSSKSVLRSTSSAYFSISARLSVPTPTPSSGSGLTISRLSRIQTATGLRSFSSSCSQCTTSRRSREFGSGFNNSYDPSLEPRRGPIYKNKTNGVPPFYPRDLKAQVDDYVVGQERAKKTICSTIFNHYQAIRRRAEVELEERNARDKLQRQQAARDREPRDLRDADSLSGTGSTVDTHRLHDTVFQRYDSEDSSPHDYSPPTAPAHHIPPPYNEPPFTPLAPTPPVRSTLDAFLNDPLQHSDDLGLPGRVNIDKSNLLLIGPTGVGKTYILETLSKKLNVPFSISDCNSLTQAGYIGQDVETCIERLLIEANYDVKAAENGIVVLDEFDKIARRETSNGRDVSGEGVQQALLKLVEGSKVTVNVKETRSSRAATPLPTTYGSSVPPPPPQGTSPTPGKTEQYTIDTRNILFVFCGAFVGLDKQVLRRVSRPALGFSSVDKPRSGKSSVSSFGGLPAETYAHLPHQPHIIPDTGVPNFSFSPLDLATPADLQAFGFIPELIGRVHNICALSNLSVDDLFRVLTEPRNCLVSQYTALFETYPSQLFFTRRALYAIAERAAKSETGARGLKMEMERVLAEPIFDAPMPYVLITEACVRGTEKPGYWGKDGRLEVERRMKEEDKTQADIAAAEAAAQASAAMAGHVEFEQNHKAAGQCGA